MEFRRRAVSYTHLCASYEIHMSAGPAEMTKPYASGTDLTAQINADSIIYRNHLIVFDNIFYIICKAVRREI